MRPLLLWTERPVLLERELETHAWMEQNRPWEVFDLELVHDREPGDWTHYSAVFIACWQRAIAERRRFLNLESDVVPTLEAFRSLLACEQLACTVPYRLFSYETGEPIGAVGAFRERRAFSHQFGMGWDAGPIDKTDEHASMCDLGFVSFSPEVMRRETPAPLRDNAGQLHMDVSHLLKRQLNSTEPWHIHRPFLRQNHRWWDEGDDAHHPPGYAASKGMLQRKPTATPEAPRARA